MFMPPTTIGAHTIQAPRVQSKRTGKIIVLRILKILLFSTVCIAIFPIAFFVYLYITLPDPTPTIMTGAPKSTHILDRHGSLLYEVHGDVKRTPLPLERIPEYAKHATIAIEDKKFYSHPGFKFTSIVRAVLVNLRHGEIRQGASTITQQMARIALLDNSPTYIRKIKEVVLAVKIELAYSKDEILEMYLNNVPYGSNAYGIEAASEIYFGKHTANLTLLEIAYLAALPKAPSDYSPFGPNVNILRARAHEVIDAMYDLGHITLVEKEAAMRDEPLALIRPPTTIKAPHFVFYIIDELNTQYGKETIENGGFIVKTSLDLTLQEKAEEIIKEVGDENERRYGAGNAALVALDQKTGEVLAMVGSRDYFRPGEGNVNVTLQPRQPGSSFKPYVYAAAFAKGILSPASIIVDVQTDFASANYGKTYIPHNYTGKNYGPISVRNALAGSLNVPAVKALVMTGIDTAIDTAEKLGITTLKDRKRFGPAIVLGGAEVTLLEHTAGFGTFGANGMRQKISPILSITKDTGEIVFRKQVQPGIQAIDPEVAYLITDVLSDTNARQYIFGQGKNLRLPDRPVAVKTGTTQEYRDAWTVGYTPDIAVGVWVGNNDNTPMRYGADGSVVAAPIWNRFMVEVHKDKQIAYFKRPEGIVEMLVDARSGTPTRFPSAFARKEVFASFNAPRLPKERNALSAITSTARIATIPFLLYDVPNEETAN
jgi:1A family penicillin-binding protein